MDIAVARFPEPLDAGALDLVFHGARTFSHFLDRPVDPALLDEIARLMQAGPTAMNTLPGRVLFLRSPEARERLIPHLSEGNRDKTRVAPVTAILAHDVAFHETMGETNPRAAGARDYFAGNEAAADAAAVKNGTLQAAYFILAARALGLDAGPMGGFNAPAVDAEFFAGTSWRSNLVVNLGYGDRDRLHPRGARLPVETVARTL